MISTGGSSSRWRTYATTQPTARPIATPPIAPTKNWPPASQTLNVPAVTATTATRYAMIAVASLMSDSPSTTVTTRRGTPIRSAIAVTATGSVGETIAPSTNAAGQDMSGTTAWRQTATATQVSSTSPTDRSEIDPTLRRRSRSEAKNAAEYSSGGRKISSTRSGSSSIVGMPGMKPIARPPRTRKIGYGTFITRASVTSVATVRSRPARKISVWAPPSTRRY